MYALTRRCPISRLRRVSLFLCSLMLVLLLGHPFEALLGKNAVLAQDLSPAQIVQTGVELYHQGDYPNAIIQWEQALEAYTQNNLAERALINENLARAYQQIGKTETALDHWEAAATDYQATNNAIQFGRALTQQAQIYTGVGQYQRTIALLCREEPNTTPFSGNDVSGICEGGAYLIAQENNDLIGQAAALGNLAEAYRFKGEYETAEQILQAGLLLVRSHNIEQYEASMLNSLGNIYARLARSSRQQVELAGESRINVNISGALQQQATGNEAQALKYFENAIAVAQANDDISVELSIQLSRLLVQQQSSQPYPLEPARQRIGALINQLPDSRETAYAGITLAKSYQAVTGDYSCPDYQATIQLEKSREWLGKSREIAISIGDERAQSFALGELGHLEECEHHWEEASELTLRAQLAASNALESADSLYLWEWQMGRLHRVQGNTDKATSDYEQSISTLEPIRTGILTADRALQFDFRDTVEPIYRQYIELLLEDSSEISDTVGPKQAMTDTNTDTIDPVQKVLKTVDSLRLAELQNFFGSDCILIPTEEEVQSRLLENNPKTVIISSIDLPGQLALIAQFPDGTLQVEKIEAVEHTGTTEESEEPETFQSIVNNFHSGLKTYVNRVYDQRLAQRLYQKIISPFEKAFESAEIETLVFIQDKVLRNIPMAALYNGEQYLIERYAIATTPALSLTAVRQPRSPSPKALAVGLTTKTILEGGQDFSALASVGKELESVEAQLPGSKILKDQSFTKENLEASLKGGIYSILHLATHGQFSTIPEDTFVITGTEDPNKAEKLTFGELEVLIRQASPNADPMDLIVLTACETATGNNREVLGLAGVTLRAGARSAIASLWKVDDRAAAEFVEHFYGYLQQSKLSKAQALQQAQIEMISDDPSDNPGRWAPLILTGNWQ